MQPGSARNMPWHDVNASELTSNVNDVTKTLVPLRSRNALSNWHRDRDAPAQGQVQRVVSDLLHEVTHAIKQLSDCFRRGVIAKNVATKKSGGPFEHEDTNPKHQCSSIRLAPTQKGDNGGHSS